MKIYYYNFSCSQLSNCWLCKLYEIFVPYRGWKNSFTFFPTLSRDCIGFQYRNKRRETKKKLIENEFFIFSMLNCQCEQRQSSCSACIRKTLIGFWRRQCNVSTRTSRRRSDDLNISKISPTRRWDMWRVEISYYLRLFRFYLFPDRRGLRHLKDWRVQATSNYFLTVWFGE